MITIAIEGADRVGKTTQCKLLCDLCDMHYVKLPNEESYSGKVLRQILNKELPMEPTSFQALMFADQLKISQKYLGNVWNVVFDRFTPSAFVYGVLKGVDKVWLEDLFGNIRDPDITIVLHGVPFETENDIYGDVVFQERVNERYIMLAEKFGWHLVNCNQTIEEVHNEIKKIIGGI